MWNPLAAHGRIRVWIEVGTAMGAAIVAFIVILAQSHGPAAEKPDVHPAQALGYKLVFSDDFDSLDLDSKARTWYSGVWFSPSEPPRENISASNSTLSLTWTPGQGGLDTSIATLSRDKRHYKAWRHGYFEARMRWTPVKGAWPAFWLIPVQDATGQNIYKKIKDSGELDVFEGQGDRPHTFYGTVHEWINSQIDRPSKDNAFRLPDDVDMTQFHTYGLLWTPGQVTWYFDNRPLHTEATPPIAEAQDFFLVLTMQEGVNWKVGNTSGVTATRMTLDVDWVRVWQK